MERKRLIWADSLKGWLILLVILGHAIQDALGNACDTNHVWNMIYSFHMPAFMAVSGFLTYRTQRVEGGVFLLCVRRFRQLGVPYFLWTIILLVVNGTFSMGTIGQYLLYPDKGFWFLYVLLLINVLFLLADWLSCKIACKQEILVGGICFFLAIIMLVLNIRVLGFQFISYYFIIYSVGYYFHKYYDIIITKKIALIICSTIVWFLLAWFWRMHEVPVFLSTVPLPNSLMLYIYRFVTATFAIYSLLAIAPLLINSTSVWNRPFEKLGRVSLGIYTTHLLFLGHIGDWFTQQGLNNFFVVLLSFIVGLAISWLIVWLLNKWKVTSIYLLGKI